MLTYLFICFRVCVCVGARGHKRIPKVLITTSHQSITIHATYHTNRNFLVSAPTSVSKTNIATLIVLRELQLNNLEGGVIHKDQFKVEQLVS